MNNEQLAPEEYKIYVYRSSDGKGVVAIGRVGVMTYANQQKKADMMGESDWEAKVKKTIGSVANSLRVRRELGYGPEDERFNEKTYKSTTPIDFTVTELVNDEFYQSAT